MFTISDTLLKAISWTLVHTIWQGFILAFLAGIVILMTKKATSTLRYNLLSGLFLLFIIVVGFTFNYEYQHENEAYLTVNFSENLKSVFTLQDGNVSNNFSTLIVDFLNKNANTIVLIWFIVFCFKCFSITTNLSHIYKIRNYRNQPVSDYWKERLEALSQNIRLNKTIVLLESQLVKVPSVTGFFKPIILLPIGMLSQLPQDQVEAILLHELAHIRRKDYFVNLLQSFVEIVFFFNPGVLWLSSLIKEERENCCDDIAVSVTKCKAKFVHALVSFQEYNMKDNELIMGFGGKKNHLLNRAKRIIHNDTKSLNGIEKTFLSVAVFAVLMVMLAFGNSKMESSGKPSTAIRTETTTTEEITTTYENEQKIKEVTKTSETKTSKSEYCEIVAQKPSVMTEDEANSLSEIDEKKAEISSENAEEKRLEAEKSKQETVKKVLTTPKNQTVTTCEKTSVTDKKIQEKERIVITADKVWESPEKMAQSIINDLTAEKIISVTVNLSYNLSDTNLIVNGKVQSDSVHKKFKQKYLKQVQEKHRVSDKISIVYNYDISNLVACN
ncbi:beta-lactamase regulating signal transducer with metallopeptidase domain [Flavobacterium arsenatis]|uniref:Beta-lactamase regulating signal transducer with metallopeptidase domain n=1 Tax=Flavobacterium arsenatis TaxID=1484332 RepID=A0ABU1TMS4_9FLAO|nr:M56 family metallopeptidase [Flavobacterium arsenatis]MDR6967259.1 beta-lactamase regulating signal transducer with metallopeptidase domain [Flavobacterium arsenatis]